MVRATPIGSPRLDWLTSCSKPLPSLRACASITPSCFGVERAGADDIDANATRGKMSFQRHAHAIDRALAGAISNRRTAADHTRAGANQKHHAFAGGEQRGGIFGAEKHALDVDVHHPLKDFEVQLFGLEKLPLQNARRQIATSSRPGEACTDSKSALTSLAERTSN